MTYFVVEGTPLGDDRPKASELGEYLGIAG